MDRTKKREYLIKKLFKVVAKETVGDNPSMPVKFRIEKGSQRGISYCGNRFDRWGREYIVVCLNLEGLLYQVKNGYSSSYYENRADRLNKYIIDNRHNALRFILWHEARHIWQKINDTKRGNEYDADSWALAHIVK